MGFLNSMRDFFAPEVDEQAVAEAKEIEEAKAEALIEPTWEQHGPDWVPYCQCGKELEENVAVCPFCGRKIKWRKKKRTTKKDDEGLFFTDVDEEGSGGTYPSESGENLLLISKKGEREQQMEDNFFEQCFKEESETPEDADAKGDSGMTIEEMKKRIGEIDAEIETIRAENKNINAQMIDNKLDFIIQACKDQHQSNIQKLEDLKKEKSSLKKTIDKAEKDAEEAEAEAEAEAKAEKEAENLLIASNHLDVIHSTLIVMAKNPVFKKKLMKLLSEYRVLD